MENFKHTPKQTKEYNKTQPSIAQANNHQTMGDPAPSTSMSASPLLDGFEANHVIKSDTVHEKAEVLQARSFTDCLFLPSPPPTNQSLSDGDYLPQQHTHIGRCY